MNENTQEKSLVKVNNKSIFFKIKKFFNNIFSKESNLQTQVIEEQNNTENDFLENIRNTENEETFLLKLQKKYRLGEIREEDLTKEQIAALCNLYDTQIARLKESNEIRKQKLKQYRIKVQSSN